MSKYASCNAFEFAHHPHAWFYRDGRPPQGARARDTAIDATWHPTNNVKSPLMVHQNQSDPLIWQYESSELFPIIFAVRDSGNTPIYIWEGESRPRPSNPQFQPMVTDHQNGESLIPAGGSLVTGVLLPARTDLETLETTVLAASTPTWITGTRYEGMDNTHLLRSLFVAYMREAKIKPYSTISLALSFRQSFDIMEAYKFYWLRAASQILHDHEGRTLIPIMTNNISIDADGLSTV